MDGYEDAEAGSAVPPFALCFFRDGNKWACVFGDFVNLAESPSGFGDTLEAARADLLANHLAELSRDKTI